MPTRFNKDSSVAVTLRVGKGRNQVNTESTTNRFSLITPKHLRRLAVIYIRQSSETQVRQNTGSTEYQRSLAAVAQSYGWPDSQIVVLDEDLGRSGSTTQGRNGWERL